MDHLRLHYVCNMHGPLQFFQRFLWHTSMEGVIGHLTLYDFITNPRLRKMSFFLT